MKYSKRKALLVDTVELFIEHSLPSWCWKLKFVRSWAERLANAVAIVQQSITSKAIQEAYKQGWKDSSRTDLNEITGSKIAAKDGGWEL